jgi:tetratricopeptide (TPR) repeat protein
VATLLGPSAAEAKAQLPEMQRRHALCPSNLDITHHVGVLLFQMGRPEEALPFFEKAYNEDRTQAVHAVNLANCLKDTGRMDRVLELSQIAYEKDSKQWSIALAYAESLMRVGQYRKAWPIYEIGRCTRMQGQLMLGI